MAFRSIQKIRFDDVDGAGIVYYPQYFHLCHKAFEDLFDETDGFSYPYLINNLRRGFPTVAIQSEFLSPLRYGDIAIIQLTLHKIGTSSTSCNFDIIRQGDNKVCFTALITWVYMDLDNHKALPIPQNLRGLFETLVAENA